MNVRLETLDCAFRVTGPEGPLESASITFAPGNAGRALAGRKTSETPQIEPKKTRSRHGASGIRCRVWRALLAAGGTRAVSPGRVALLPAPFGDGGPDVVPRPWSEAG